VNRLPVLVAFLSLAALADEPPPAPLWVSLQVAVVPSLDPSGKPWKVQLLERRDEKDDVFADKPVPARGNLELKVVEKHLYSLRLKTADGDIWLTDSEPFEAANSMAVRKLEPKAEKVRGLVTIGKRPLAQARLTFGTEDGRESVSLTSKEDGTFRGRSSAVRALASRGGLGVAPSPSRGRRGRDPQ
jgi:hypothetical protein